MNTAAKRSSAINVRSPWRGQLPFPDGTIGAGDRQATATMYSGILAEAAVAEESADTFVAGGGGRFIGYKALGEPIRLVPDLEPDPTTAPKPRTRRKRTRAELPPVKFRLAGRAVGSNSTVLARAWVPAVDLPTLHGTGVGSVGAMLVPAALPAVQVPALSGSTRTVRGPDLESLQMLGLLGLI